MADYKSAYTGAQIDDAVSKAHQHNNKTILDNITAPYTTEEKTKLAGLNNYTLPVASSTVLGGIKVGANLTITNDGTLNATSSGETGTTDYPALSNKPQINGVELIGNKTSEELGITGGGNILIFENITLETTAFVEDTTYEAFGYKADISCTGVTAEFFSDVVFGVEEATSGNYAPISLSGTGIITIYAVYKPESTITIPSIICSKGA